MHRHTIALLLAVWVGDVRLHDAGVPRGEQALEFANDEGDSLRLRMWANSWLVHCASSGLGSLGTSSVNALYGDADIID